jgi:antirestriction protein
MKTGRYVETPQVWVGCLACYNAGRLVGEWTDADIAGDLTTVEIHEHAALLPIVVDGETVYVQEDGPSPHEELWCFDYQGFPEGAMSGECSPCEAQRIAEKLDELEEETGMPLGAIAAYASEESISITDLDAEQLQEHYFGEYESKTDFAEQFTRDTAPSQQFIDWLDEGVGSYIERERVWTGDFRSNGWWTAQTPDYNYWVFSP